jgi:diguanylate cyclase (GGDEF)-like protein
MKTDAAAPRGSRLQDAAPAIVRVGVIWVISWASLLALVAIMPVQSTSMDWIVSVIALPATIFALPLLAWKVSRDLTLPAGVRRSWRIMTRAWLTASVAQLAAGLSLAAPAVSAYADVAAAVLSLSAIALMLRALHAMPSAPRTARARVRAAVDHGTMFLSVTLLLWLPSATSLWGRTGGRSVEDLATLVYPSVEAGIVVAVVAALSRERSQRIARSLRFLGAGVCLLVVSQTAQDPSGVLAGHPGIGLRVSLLLGGLALVAFALAAASQVHDAADVERLLPRAEVNNYVPYLVPLAAASCALLVVADRAVAPERLLPLALAAVVALVGMALSSWLLSRENKALTLKLFEGSYTDPLTRCVNRRYLSEVVTAVAIAYPMSMQSSVLLIDVDDFKLVNDELGHAAGDQLLSLIAETCRKNTRPGDVVARLGGDEFAVYMPNADHDDATRAAARIASRVRLIVLDADPQTGSAQPSVSIGVAAGSVALSLESLLAAADEALYEAKNDPDRRPPTAWRDLQGHLPNPRSERQVDPRETSDPTRHGSLAV